MALFDNKCLFIDQPKTEISRDLLECSETTSVSRHTELDQTYNLKQFQFGFQRYAPALVGTAHDYLWKSVKVIEKQ